MADVRRITLDEVVRHFEELEDPRCSINRKHPLVSVVVIAMMAVPAGAGGPTAIARWAALKEDFLVTALDLPNGVPGKDVFRRVLMALHPEAFRTCFVSWLESLRAEAAAATGIEQPVLAVDGKTARRSHDRRNGLGALHSVSVWASEFGLSLGQVACAAKSNEITAIPEVLRVVDLKGAILTIDAMGAQKAIAAQIIDGEGDYVLALKGNQEALHQAVIDSIDERLEGELEGAQEHVTVETGHGREETRTYLQLPAPEGLPGFGLWKALRTIAVVTSLCIRICGARNSSRHTSSTHLPSAYNRVLGTSPVGRVVPRLSSEGSTRRVIMRRSRTTAVPPRARSVQPVASSRASSGST